MPGNRSLSPSSFAVVAGRSDVNFSRISARVRVSFPTCWPRRVRQFLFYVFLETTAWHARSGNRAVTMQWPTAQEQCSGPSGTKNAVAKSALIVQWPTAQKYCSGPSGTKNAVAKSALIVQWPTAQKYCSGPSGTKNAVAKSALIVQWLTAPPAQHDGKTKYSNRHIKVKKANNAATPTQGDKRHKIHTVRDVSAGTLWELGFRGHISVPA
eukprot:100937-Pelagomonas_calceolata.AAC.3